MSHHFSSEIKWLAIPYPWLLFYHLFYHPSLTFLCYFEQRLRLMRLIWTVWTRIQRFVDVERCKKKEKCLEWCIWQNHKVNCPLSPIYCVKLTAIFFSTARCRHKVLIEVKQRLRFSFHGQLPRRQE